MSRILIRIFFGVFMAVLLSMIAFTVTRHYVFILAEKSVIPMPIELTHEIVENWVQSDSGEQFIREKGENSDIPMIYIRKDKLDKSKYDANIVALQRPKFYYFEDRSGLSVFPIGNDRLLIVGPFEFHLNFPVLVVVISMAATFLIVIFVALFLAFPLVRNIKKLDSATAKMAEGDLSTRVTVTCNDDIGTLAKRFNAMAENNENLFKQQSQLLQAVAHELKTPVARIRFGLEMLDIQEEGTNAERLLAIDEDLSEIDNLLTELSFFNMVNRREIYHPEEIEVRNMTERALKQCSIYLENLDIVRKDWYETTVLTEPRYFLRVMTNLILNASRYARGQIRICMEDMGNMVKISVEDDGPGIPAKDRERVLEPFVSLDESRSKRQGGVGLGLAIVNQIMKKSGGSLAISDSEIGGTAVVTVWPKVFIL